MRALMTALPTKAWNRRKGQSRLGRKAKANGRISTNFFISTINEGQRLLQELRWDNMLKQACNLFLFLVIILLFIL